MNSEHLCVAYKICTKCTDQQEPQVIILVKHIPAKRGTEGVITLSNRRVAFQMHEFRGFEITHTPVLSEPVAPAGLAAEDHGVVARHPEMGGPVVKKSNKR